MFPVKLPGSIVIQLPSICLYCHKPFELSTDSIPKPMVGSAVKTVSTSTAPTQDLNCVIGNPNS